MPRLNQFFFLGILAIFCCCAIVKAQEVGKFRTLNKHPLFRHSIGGFHIQPGLVYQSSVDKPDTITFDEFALGVQIAYDFRTQRQAENIGIFSNNFGSVGMGCDFFGENLIRFVGRFEYYFASLGIREYLWLGTMLGIEYHHYLQIPSNRNWSQSQVNLLFVDAYNFRITLGLATGTSASVKIMYSL